jgi:hypothetical protein
VALSGQWLAGQLPSTFGSTIHRAKGTEARLRRRPGWRALVTRRAPGVIAGHSRRRATPPRHIELRQIGHGTPRIGQQMPVPPYTSEETAASARLGKASVCPRKAGARTRPRLVPCRRLAGGGADDRLQAEAAVTNPGEIRIPTRDTTIFRRGPASLGGIVTVRKVRHLCARTGAGWISAIAVVPHGFGNGDALSAQGQRPALGLWVRSTAPACRQRPEQDDDRTLPRTAAPDTATGAR